MLTAAGEGRAPHTGSASCAPSSRPAAGYLPWAASRRQAAASTWPQVFAGPLPGPLQARPSTAPASPPARSRAASNAGPRGAARSGDPSAPQAAMSRYRHPQPKHSRPAPAWMPDRAVDPPQQPTPVPLTPSATPEAQHSQGGPGHDLCSQPPGRAARPGPGPLRPSLSSGRAAVTCRSPRPVPQPPPALGGEGAAARRGVGVGAPLPPPARTPRPTAGRAGAAAPRGSLRPARSLDYSPLRRASGRAPPAEAVAASLGPKAARLRVFSLHSPNTQEITECQVTARSQ